jgi:hypothetical protein
LPPLPVYELAPWLAALTGLILVAGSTWIVLGAAIKHGTGISPRAGYRAGALGLLLLATAVGCRAAGFL